MVILLVQCSKEPDPITNNPTITRNCKLSVIVQECLDPYCDAYLGLAGETVALFRNQEDAILNNDRITSGTTNNEGVCLFSNLEFDNYYIRINLKDGNYISEENTPNNSHSYHYVPTLDSCYYENNDVLKCN